MTKSNNGSASKLSFEENLEASLNYLSKTGISWRLKDVLSQLARNKPANPIQFISDYFVALEYCANGASPCGNYEMSINIALAYRQIMLCKYSNPLFIDNLASSYNILNSHPIASESSASAHSLPGASIRGIGNGVAYGLTGSVLGVLVQLLCYNMPSTLTSVLVDALCRKQFASVSFEMFKMSVCTCLLMEEFIDQVNAMFFVISDKEKEAVPRALFSMVTAEVGIGKNRLEGYMQSNFNGLQGQNSVNESISYGFDHKKFRTLTQEALQKDTLLQMATSKDAPRPFAFYREFLSKILNIFKL
eukprot:Nk52_evm18s311 gene=Nk52_evmTU18s311